MTAAEGDVGRGGMLVLWDACVSISVYEHERTSTDDVVHVLASGSSFMVGAQWRREPRVMLGVEVTTHEYIEGVESSKHRGEVWAELTGAAADGMEIKVDYGYSGVRDMDGDTLNFHIWSSDRRIKISRGGQLRE